MKKDIFDNIIKSMENQFEFKKILNFISNSDFENLTVNDSSSYFPSSIYLKELTDSKNNLLKKVNYLNKSIDYKYLNYILIKKNKLENAKKINKKSEKKIVKEIFLTNEEKNYLKRAYIFKIRDTDKKLFRKLYLCEKHLAVLHEQERAIITHKCRSKFCFKCQHNKSVFNQAVLDKYVNRRESGEYLKLLTLTTKNVMRVDEVMQNYYALQRCWAGLLKLWRYRGYKLDFYIRAFEITHTNKEGFHLHFHVFLDSEFVNKKELNYDWSRLGVENGIVNKVTHIKAIRFLDWQSAKYEKITQIFKYVLKDEFVLLGLKDEDVVPFVASLFRKKQYIIGGKSENKKMWKQCVKEVREDFEEIAKQKQTGYTKEYAKIYNPKTKNYVDLRNVFSLETLYEDIYSDYLFEKKDKFHYYFENYESLSDLDIALKKRKILREKEFPLREHRINHFEFEKDENGQILSYRKVSLIHDCYCFYLFWFCWNYSDFFDEKYHKFILEFLSLTG